MRRTLHVGDKMHELEVHFSLYGEDEEPATLYNPRVEGFIDVCEVRVERFGEWDRTSENDPYFRDLDSLAEDLLRDKIVEIVHDEFVRM